MGFRYILCFCLIGTQVCASAAYLAPSEASKKAANLISDAEQNLNGDPIKNYKEAIGLLSRQGQMSPNDMLLLARAFVAVGNRTRISNPGESQDYFNRAMVVLEQIPQQVKMNPQSDSAGVLQQSIGLWQQAKNGLPPTK